MDSEFYLEIRITRFQKVNQLVYLIRLSNRFCLHWFIQLSDFGQQLNYAVTKLNFVAADSYRWTLFHNLCLNPM